MWLCASAVAFQKKQPGMKDTIDQVTTTDNRIVFFQRIAETSIFLGNQSIDTKRELQRAWLLNTVILHKFQSYVYDTQ